MNYCLYFHTTSRQSNPFVYVRSFSTVCIVRQDGVIYMKVQKVYLNSPRMGGQKVICFNSDGNQPHELYNCQPSHCTTEPCSSHTNTHITHAHSHTQACRCFLYTSQGITCPHLHRQDRARGDNLEAGSITTRILDYTLAWRCRITMIGQQAWKQSKIRYLSRQWSKRERGWYGQMRVKLASRLPQVHVSTLRLTPDQP